MGQFLALSAAIALLAGGMTWLVARRHGRRVALLVPLLSLVAVALMLGRETGTNGYEVMGLTAAVAVFVGPALVGGMLALMLSRLPR